MPMSTTVELECLCGTVKGQISVVPRSFFHVHCLCCDCQSFARYLNNEANILDEHGGSELFQTYPQYMVITQGQDKIRAMQFGPKGLYRWHTTCCNMPLANTMTSHKVPFVGVSVKLMKFSDDEEKQRILGPVIMKAYGKYAIGEMPNDVHSTFPISYTPKILSFMISGMFRKMNTPSPFFKNGKPVSGIDVVANR